MKYKSEIEKLDKNELIELLNFTAGKLNESQLKSILSIIYNMLNKSV